ncbi:hypothetical protein SAY87_031783 [Trapa incisa]|uniref:Uncharacterized protein n=1 Tax=Trapa incisa TaxID=236973 RepID=A0AAN7KQ11_9MYRT|nr:hypothetical protein SAY87_031783 [Trapa incisa]
MQPCRPERPAATPDDRAGALLRAAPSEDRPLGELRRRILLPEDEQRDPERRHVPPGQLRLAAEGEQGAEARDLEDEGEAQRAGEGADGDEAGDGGQGREREDAAEFDLEGVRDDWDLRWPEQREEAEIRQEIPEPAAFHVLAMAASTSLLLTVHTLQLLLLLHEMR